MSIPDNLKLIESKLGALSGKPYKLTVKVTDDDTSEDVLKRHENAFRGRFQNHEITGGIFMGKGGFPGGGFGGGNMQQILKQAQKCKPICSALRKNLKIPK